MHAFPRAGCARVLMAPPNSLAAQSQVEVACRLNPSPQTLRDYRRLGGGSVRTLLFVQRDELPQLLSTARRSVSPVYRSERDVLRSVGPNAATRDGALLLTTAIRKQILLRQNAGWIARPPAVPPDSSWKTVAEGEVGPQATEVEQPVVRVPVRAPRAFRSSDEFPDFSENRVGLEGRLLIHPQFPPPHRRSRFGELRHLV